jgi:hypothetical protein
MKHDSKTGSSHPLGATLSGGGANFSLFSRQETPHDIVPWEKALKLSGSTYRVDARSVVVLYAPF